MVNLADAINGWLKEVWPTLYAVFIPRVAGRPFIAIARKGSNHWILTFWADTGEINFGNDLLRAWVIGNPADPKYLDRLNGCLIRVCKGKDLK